MSTPASPFEIAVVLAAVGWPFAAGLVVVLWSRARTAKGEGRTAASDRLARVIEALEEAQAKRAKLSAKAPLTQA